MLELEGVNVLEGLGRDLGVEFESGLPEERCLLLLRRLLRLRWDRGACSGSKNLSVISDVGYEMTLASFIATE